MTLDWNVDSLVDFYLFLGLDLFIDWLLLWFIIGAVSYFIDDVCQLILLLRLWSIFHFYDVVLLQFHILTWLITLLTLLLFVVLFPDFTLLLTFGILIPPSTISAIFFLFIFLSLFFIIAINCNSDQVIEFVFKGVNFVLVFFGKLVLWV